MPRYICKITDEGTDWYMEWSTVVDAPVVYGMSLEEFKAYYRDEYGRQAFEGYEFEDRMKRVEEKGTSARDYNSFEDLIRCNRAGKGESCLSMEQIIEWYVRRVARGEAKDGERCQLQGKVFNFDTEEYEDYKPPAEKA